MYKYVSFIFGTESEHAVIILVFHFGTEMVLVTSVFYSTFILRRRWNLSTYIFYFRFGTESVSVTYIILSFWDKISICNRYNLLCFGDRIGT